MPAAQVPAALSVGTASSSMSRMTMFRSHINWKIVARFVPPALPAVWLGAWLLKYFNPIYLELVLGAFLVSNLTMVFKKDTPASSSQLPLYGLSLIGAAAGFVSGLTGAVGLLFNRFYLRYGMSKEQIVATRAANEILLHLVKIALYASFGLLTAKGLGFGALIAVAAIVSSWAMKWVLPRISARLFRTVGYIAMVVSGLSLLGGAGTRLARDNVRYISFQPISNGVQTQVQWRQGFFTLEFEFDEGPEVEVKTSLNELPAEKQQIARKAAEGSEKMIIEEVFGIGKHYYELYVFRDGLVEKINI